MNSLEVISAIEDAVENDSKLNEWCTSNLPGLPNIFIGYDGLKPPGRELYPLIIVFDITPDEESVRASTVNREIAISCGIYNESVNKTDRKIKYDGMIQSEAFREEVSKAVLRKFLGKITIKPLGTEAVYPLFASGMTVTVKSPYKFDRGGQ